MAKKATFQKPEIKFLKGGAPHAPLLILFQVIVALQVFVAFEGLWLDRLVQTVVHFLDLVRLFRLSDAGGRVVLVGLLSHAENVHFFGPPALGLVFAPGAGARRRHAVVLLLDVRVEGRVGKVLLAAAAIVVPTYFDAVTLLVLLGTAGELLLLVQDLDVMLDLVDLFLAGGLGRLGFVIFLIHISM